MPQRPPPSSFCCTYKAIYVYGRINSREWLAESTAWGDDSLAHRALLAMHRRRQLRKPAPEVLHNALSRRRRKGQSEERCCESVDTWRWTAVHESQAIGT